MDFTFIQAIWTVVVMVVFIGIVIWAWSDKRRQRFEDAANIPFNEDAHVTGDATGKEKSHG